MKSFICHNCGQSELAASRGADCPCGGTYSMNPQKRRTRVLWLSRHTMSDEQANSLREFIGEEIEIIPENTTWAASSDGSADRIRNATMWRQLHQRLTSDGQRLAYVAGVFPPVALEALKLGRPFTLRLLAPVSEQAPELRVGDGPIPYRHLRWSHL
jgi:hypothetical protein